MEPNTHFEFDTPTARCLSLSLQDSVTTYVNFSNPLCAALWNENKRDWLHEHFTGLYSIGTEDEYFWLDYLEPLHFLSELGDYRFLDAQQMEPVEDVVEFIKEHVDRGRYGMVFVDAFHLSQRRTAGVHEPLQMFWYGYDSAEETIFSIGFDRDHTYVPIRQTYAEVAQAYRSLREQRSHAPVWVRLYNVVLFAMSAPEEVYRLTPGRVLASVQDYLRGAGTPDQLRPEIRAARGEQAIFGSRVQNQYVRHLANLLEGRFTTDYRSMHLLAEHKKLLYRKLCRVAELLGRADAVVKPLADYLVIVKRFEQARIGYLKEVFRESGLISLYGQLRNEKVIRHAMETVAWAAEAERKVLEQIHELLTRDGLHCGSPSEALSS